MNIDGFVSHKWDCFLHNIGKMLAMEEVLCLHRRKNSSWLIVYYRCRRRRHHHHYYLAWTSIDYSSYLAVLIHCWRLALFCLQIAAMFKIGNSKELPSIPDHLSDDAKDFIRHCLQREPSCRPTAAELLQHSFVKNAAPLHRSIPSSEPLELLASVPCGATYKVININMVSLFKWK